MKGEIMSREEICMAVFLGVNAWTDIRKREICFPVLCIFLVGGILCRIADGTLFPDGVFSAGIGMSIIGMSVLSRGRVGFGDGLLLLAMGTVLNYRELAGVLCISLFLCAIYAGILALVLKKGRNKEIPFAPFLLAGYLGGVFF